MQMTKNGLGRLMYTNIRLKFNSDFSDNVSETFADVFNKRQQSDNLGLMIEQQRIIELIIL